VRGKIGPTEFEATASQAQAAAQVAAASDADLVHMTEPAQSGERAATATVAPQDVVALRREAVEEVMRQAARWGWSAARAGFVDLPNSTIEWDSGGRPTIVTRPTARDRVNRLIRQLGEEPRKSQLEQFLTDMVQRQGDTAHGQGDGNGGS